MGLDVTAAATVKNWIQALSSQYGKTLILTTHQLDLAEELCQRIAIMQQGRKVSDHTVMELRNLHRKEAIKARVSADSEEMRVWVRQLWPDASLEYDLDAISLTIPSNGSRRLADVAAALDQWPCDILSLEQTVPSLEDIFVKITESPRQHV